MRCLRARQRGTFYIIYIERIVRDERILFLIPSYGLTFTDHQFCYIYIYCSLLSIATMRTSIIALLHTRKRIQNSERKHSSNLYLLANAPKKKRKKTLRSLCFDVRCARVLYTIQLQYCVSAILKRLYSFFIFFSTCRCQSCPIVYIQLPTQKYM